MPNEQRPYSPTPLQILQHTLKWNAALADPHIERFEIFRAFGQLQSHRVVEDF